MTPSTSEARRLTLLALFAVSFDRADDDPAVRLSRPDLWRFVAPYLSPHGIGRNAFTAALRDLTEAHPELLADGGTAHGRRPVVAVVDFKRDADSPALWTAGLSAEGIRGSLADHLADLGIPSRALGGRRVPGLAPDCVVLTDGRVRANALRAEAAEDLRLELVDDEGRLECRGCLGLLPADDDTFSDYGARRRRCKECERARDRARRGSLIPPDAPPQKPGRPRGGSLRHPHPVSSTSSPELTEDEIAAAEARYAAEVEAEARRRAELAVVVAERRARDEAELDARSRARAEVDAHNDARRAAIDEAERAAGAHVLAVARDRSRTLADKNEALALRAYVLAELVACREELATALRRQLAYRDDVAPIPALP